MEGGLEGRRRLYAPGEGAISRSPASGRTPATGIEAQLPHHEV